MNTPNRKKTSSVVGFFLITNLVTLTDAFAFSPFARNSEQRVIFQQKIKQQGWHQTNFLHPSTSSTTLQESNTNSEDEKDDEIDRLRSMAAKLRAEAASLEAEKAEQKAIAIEKVFAEFDTNQDGEIDINELKTGIERTLKTELSTKRVEELMKEFDESGDGKLQLDEFVTIDQFRNRLEALTREERRLAVEAQKNAKKEEEEAALAQARLDILNDREPTVSDRVVSVLPYLFPLLDGLQYGRFLLGGEDGSNPFVVALAVIYSLYRNIPFSGILTFFALNFLSNNPSINRLVRFNMQQAIFVDIALFFPGLVTGVLGLILGGMKTELPASVVQLGTDAIFVTLLLALGYCTVSSLLGIAPNKLPILSNAVEDRMPTVDMFDIDRDGNIKLREREEGKKDDDKKE